MATAAKRVALILGAGPNIGTSVAQRFTASGSFVVAVVSRSGKPVPASTATLSLAADFADPTSIKGIFEKVRKELGEPSVVVYNAAAVAMGASEPFSVDLQTFATHLAINTTSAYAAASEAVQSFAAVHAKDKTIPTAFIYTGNGLNTMIMTPLMTLGVGKAATAHLVELGAKAYGDKGYGFYYADERKPDGAVAGREIDGNAHAEHYYYLATQTVPVDWNQTFVKEKGHVKF